LSGDIRLEVCGVIVAVGGAFHVTAAYGVHVGDVGIGTDLYWVDRVRRPECYVRVAPLGSLALDPSHRVAG
jgi:hypothetical protein